MRPYRASCTAAPVADGFADDCEELIHRCLQSDTLNYHVFCNIWKDMNFGLVFQGGTTGAEVAEISEELIFIAKRYMITNTSNYEESVAGLFLVYALVHLQPYTGFAPLRITPNDLDAIQCIKDIAQKQKRYDVLYILGSLLIEGPVQYHIAEREHGLESQVRKGFEVTSSSTDEIGVRPRGVFFRQNEELDLLRELSSLGRRYTRAKACVTGSSRPDRTLSYVNEHMASELSASLKQLINGNEGDAQQPVSRHDKVQSIKHRAMVETVSQMKHLVSVEARTNSTETDGPSTSKPEVRTKPGKIKTGSPTKPLPTSSEKRHTTSKLIPKAKRRKCNDSSDSSSDEQFVPSGESDDDISSEKDSDIEGLGTIDDVIENIKKKQNKTMESPNDTSIDGNVQIEIEIIDEVTGRPIEFNAMGHTGPRIICENSNNSAELIIPDLIVPDKETEVSELESNKKVKPKRGGLRPANKSGNAVRKSTKSRLGAFGILPIIKRDKNDT